MKKGELSGPPQSSNDMMNKGKLTTIDNTSVMILLFSNDNNYH